MKKILSGLLLIGIASLGFAQTSNSCDTTYLKSEKNIKKLDQCIPVISDYVLKQPLHDLNEVGHFYRGFILKWMDKTPDYTFHLNDKMMDICKEDNNLLLFGVYTTCLAKSSVQFKKSFDKEAIKIFVTYISNPDNKVEQTAKIKKLIADAKANRIEAYVK